MSSSDSSGSGVLAFFGSFLAPPLGALEAAGASAEDDTPPEGIEDNFLDPSAINSSKFLDFN